MVVVALVPMRLVAVRLVPVAEVKVRFVKLALVEVMEVPLALVKAKLVVVALVSSALIAVRLVDVMLVKSAVLAMRLLIKWLVLVAFVSTVLVPVAFVQTRLVEVWKVETRFVTVSLLALSVPMELKVKLLVVASRYVNDPVGAVRSPCTTRAAVEVPPAKVMVLVVVFPALVTCCSVGVEVARQLVPSAKQTAFPVMVVVARVDVPVTVKAAVEVPPAN